MVDEIYDRHYAAARGELNALISHAVSRASKAALNAFSVLNRIEYEAPWAAKASRTR